MFKKIGTTIILILMILNGLFFVSNIYVLGNTEAAIEMHDDLPRSASALLANAKVIDCFIVGILYLVAAYGIIREKYSLALAGVVGCVLFVGLYVFQLIMWAGEHPRMWLDFAIFGGLSLLLGVYSWWNWRKRTISTGQNSTTDKGQAVVELSL
jgi:hypothetical protein